MKAFFIVVGVVAFIAGASVWSGFALSILWAWFITPVFHVPHLSIPSAIGLSLVVSMFTSKPDPSNKKEEKNAKLIYGTIYAVFLPALTLVLGAIVHLFM